MRLLQQHMGEILDGKGSLLPQFATLDQMVLLLTLEKPADLQYYKVTAETSSMTEKQIKKVLKQRIDFEGDVIDKLKVFYTPPS